jgi:predicted  nucleic acid-binding Zn-ribbon protein
MNHDSRSVEDELSPVKADVAVIRSNYSTKEDLHEFPIELKDEIHALRIELKDDIHALRTELKAEIGGLGGELRADITGLRIDIEKLRTEMQEMRAEFHKALHAQTWKMYGFGVVLVAAVHFVTRAGY